jgi:hypothetical protein
MRDIRHEICALLVGNFAEGLVIPITGISGGTADQQAGLEQAGLRRQVVVVDEMGFRIETVWERLEVD